MSVPKSVLVVDDDSGIRDVLEYNLQEEGYVVHLAESAEAGWRSFRKEPPDLVITDVRMAGSSGLELLRKILDAVPDEPVIVITAYGSIRQAVDAMKRGAFDYVTKPFDRDALKLSVRRALEYANVRRENVALRRELKRQHGIRSIVGKSPVMEALFRTIARVAPTESTVLIQGETGTGKELVARALHHASSRSSGNFVAVNCTAIPRELMETELFGHTKGAFTGAVGEKTGKFELANGGTVFLDEIGDIEQELQKKLLRVLQEREIDTVGAPEPRPVDVRVVAATNQSLAAQVERGAFRKDLYYRLNVVPIGVPPLRERRDDIPILIDHFLERFGAPDVRVDDDALQKLLGHAWPGNVRELENTIERALILREKPDRIQSTDLSFGEIVEGSPANASVDSTARAEAWATLPEEGIPLDQVEKRLIEEAIAKTGGNQSAAARLLGISRQTLIYRMQKHSIQAKR